MKAAIQHRYGPPNVLELTEVPRPAIAAGDVLVQVHASPVTQGDRRMRSADFPGITWLPGRLLVGMFRPKHPIPGTMFAGRVAAVGASVTAFRPGDDVFGEVDHGAHTEFLVVPADGRIATLPEGLAHDAAAAVPYGAVTALTFLRHLAKVQPGEHVLVLGASGGVGRFAVQLAKHDGATVTGVCSARNHALVRSLGADHVIDYHTDDFHTNGQRYDVVLDTIGATRFDRCRGSLTERGRYLSLLVTIRLLWQSLLTSAFGGKRAMVGVAMGSHADMQTIRALVADGALKPLVDRTFPLARIGEAHMHLESGQPQGTVVVTMAA